NGQYTVQLTAGMTLQDAADKLNTILTGNQLPLAASVANGRLQLQSSFYGGNYGFSVVSSLDDGAGGTDLGGTEAGATQAYYGQNVAGTIGGKAAQGWGQWLTGTEGGVQDLKLLITSATTGDKGVVKVSQGFASRLAAYAERAAGTDDSLLTRATTSITNEISDLTEEAQSLQDSVNAYVEQLQLKFATMEGVLAKNKTLLSYLTTQVESLQGLTTDQNA
ncbi:MAG: flagellar filament capping protein FliD, partial [Armatimonadetes bacterium]|nr:flagellar filament capping protein FliD [Armatimonadota bacterium]